VTAISSISTNTDRTVAVVVVSRVYFGSIIDILFVAFKAFVDNWSPADFSNISLAEVFVAGLIGPAFFSIMVASAIFVGIASRVPRVTLALACSEGLYTLFYPSS
jgi:hypothetical protein